MNKKLIRLLLIVITLFTITLNAYAIDPNSYITEENKEETPSTDQQEQTTEGYDILIEDNASRITYVEEESLKSQMTLLQQEGNVVFKSISYNTKTTKEYAEEFYKEKFGEESGILILFDFHNGNIYLYTAGEVGTKFTSEQAQEIVNAAVPLVNEKKEYDAVSTMISKLEEVLGLKTSISEETHGHTLLIEDDAKLLTEEEVKKLKEKMKPLTKYGHIVFKSISTNPKYSTKEFANDYYYSKFGNESGTIFIIDMDKRMIYIVSAGENYEHITDSKADIITDNIYKYATRKEYYECAEKAFEQIGIVLDGGKIAEPMRHASNVVIAIVLAFFINFFIVLNASKLKKATNSEVLKNCDIAFEAGNVDGRKTGTHKVYSPPSSSSSGGSSGGGGGGGGFSGGGGGHSF